MVSAERGHAISDNVCHGLRKWKYNSACLFFSIAKFHYQMLRGGPIGALGLENCSKNRWMAAPFFIKVFQNIQNITKGKKKILILILMDNYDSQCSLEGVVYAGKNGMVLVTFSPHCTHRLQFLNVAVMGSFKSKFSIVQNNWLRNNPVKT